MGIYLNPDSRLFRIAVNSEIYVDKTPVILCLNSLVDTAQRFVSVSRPRRFGKTMAADMICAYYGRDTDAYPLFSDCKISRYENWNRYLGQFDVIRIVMTDFIKRNRTVESALNTISGRVLSELSEAYPNVVFEADDLPYSLGKFYQKTRKPFVIVIDEWDVLFREYPNDLEGQKRYLDFLRDLLKDKAYVALAYMTGILPVKKYGKHSALNMFTEYSMIYPQELAGYTGFTQEEVQILCNQYGRNYSDLQRWYDGYRVTDIIPPDPEHEIYRTTGESPEAVRYSLYNPLSVVQAVRTGAIRNYWNNTETYEELSKYISMNFDGLRETVVMMMNGSRQAVDIRTYQNDMTSFTCRDDILTMLIHLGYLTFDAGEVFIPNKEVLDEFRTSTGNESWKPLFQLLRNSQRLLEATWSKNAGTVAQLMEEAHLSAGTDGYHSEEGPGFAIQLAYYNAVNYYTLFSELPTGKGYADKVYIPRPEYADKPVLLIELKYDENADTAISQIHRRQYPKGLDAYKGNILLVGINCNRDVNHEAYRHHSCVIENA